MRIFPSACGLKTRRGECDLVRRGSQLVQTKDAVDHGADATAAAFDLNAGETARAGEPLAGARFAETAVALDIAPSTAKSISIIFFSKPALHAKPNLMRLGTGLVPPTRSKILTDQHSHLSDVGRLSTASLVCTIVIPA